MCLLILVGYNIKMDNLSEIRGKQIFFCHEYLKDFNGTQAAIRAGYSVRSAYSQAHDLLKKPEILNYIELESQSTFKSIGLTTQRIISEIVSIAFSENSSKKEKLKALEILLKYESLKSDKTSGDQLKYNIPIEFVDSN
jgi:phage terminase small subunit